MTQAVEERRALVDKLAAQLQARVLSGELVSGTRLRQEALADEFGVSRTPIREALRKLQEGGLVELRPHRGAVVRGPSAREIRDAQGQFRETLARMMEVRSDGGMSAVPADEIDRWRHANDRFHQLIQAAAANDVLVATLAHLHRSFPRDLTQTVLGESTTLLAENVHEHEAVLAAIQQRDATEARELMIKHVRHAGALVTLRFEQRG
jgi:DNA-binding GntR family transcriptional regulator